MSTKVKKNKLEVKKNQEDEYTVVHEVSDCKLNIETTTDGKSYLQQTGKKHTKTIDDVNIEGTMDNLKSDEGQKIIRDMTWKENDEARLYVKHTQASTGDTVEGIAICDISSPTGGSADDDDQTSFKLLFDGIPTINGQTAE